jgi:hypothetical protein
MRQQKPRTYKTLNGAKKYAQQLMDKYPGKTFSALPDPRLGSFLFVVGYLIENDLTAPSWALCE